ncbi:MAG: alcohol dehydrogenase catalytic domain-containing protein [Pirellulales bacterium]
MRAICFEDIAKLKVSDLAEPTVIESSDCIVQVEMAGLCGSDLHPYWGREKGLDPGTVMGHEFVGKIVQLGSNVPGLAVGERVFAPFSTNCGDCYFCNHGLPSRCRRGQLFGWRSNGNGLHGGQAEFVRVPLASGTLLKVPDGMSSELALLLGDNLSTGYFCTELAETKPGGVYAVLGCGNVGLMALSAAKLKGCHNLVAFDLIAERREMAEQLGAIVVSSTEAAIATVSRLTDGRGADAVMELVGMPDAQRLAYELVRPGGTIATVGCHCDSTFAFSPVDAYDKNLTYRTGRCPARFYMEKLAELEELQNFNWRSFITHCFSLDDGPIAYDLFSKRKQRDRQGVFDLPLRELS